MDTVPAQAQTVCMTFTLPRLHRPSRAASAPIRTGAAAASTAPTPAPQTSDVPMTVFMEVVLPAHQVPPRVPGWQLRLWPTASLGDATLEARPDSLQVSVASLTDALHAQGIQTLGLTRRRS